MANQPDTQRAAKNLTLDNLEDKIDSLREASAPTRNSKKLRDAARLEKKRLERKQKLEAATRLGK